MFFNVSFGLFSFFFSLVHWRLCSALWNHKKTFWLFEWKCHFSVHLSVKASEVFFSWSLCLLLRLRMRPRDSPFVKFKKRWRARCPYCLIPSSTLMCVWGGRGSGQGPHCIELQLWDWARGRIQIILGVSDHIRPPVLVKPHRSMLWHFGAEAHSHTCTLTRLLFLCLPPSPF